MDWCECSIWKSIRRTLYIRQTRPQKWLPIGIMCLSCNKIMLYPPRGPGLNGPPLV